MFQQFSVTATPGDGVTRVEMLREKLRQNGLHAFLVPHGDEHQNEYLPPCNERLAWLTGFTGSAGFCIVLLDRAILFVDGRYTLQAAQQTDPAVFTIENLVETPPSKWLAANLQEGGKIGYDPWLITIGQKKNFAGKVAKAGASLAASDNLVDKIWHDRPAQPLGQVQIHPLDLAGRDSSDKIAELNAFVADYGADLCLLTDPTSIAWTFNIRGSDVAHTPLALAYAILARDGKPSLFIDPRKLDERAARHLDDLAWRRAPTELRTTLLSWARGKKVLCDPERVSAGFAELVDAAGGEVVNGRDPVVLPRAIKNDAEIAGSRAAHLRDGVALAKFLAWLDRQPPGSIDEIVAARRLEEFRAATAAQLNSELRDLAFDTISGAGANGAIVHYRVNEKTNAVLGRDSLYLVDSGAQYPDGTTDITRTVPIGEPPEGAREDFTLVLKGHIAIATARFPAGTRGMDLDPLARAALWRTGRDYLHGTGHGIGSYLAVHEGPQSLSRRGKEVLRTGMILSNEPGFYRAGKYGIRIENLVLVTPALELPGGNSVVHAFETLSLAPIDLRLIDPALLDDGEIAWLDSYHARVQHELSPHLSAEDRQWLEQATQAVER
jgi:Xaa-Pro aminopeptidase